ncbi:MAG: methyltransferase domain-containing protein [Bacteroidales bacterium]
MPIFRPGPGPYALALAMTGVRLGERLLYIGSGTPAMFAALAAKVGVSGRAAAVDEEQAGSSALEQAGTRQGVLVETRQTQLGYLPFESDAFDLIVVDRTRMTTDAAAAWLPDARRVLRAGGRLVVAERLALGGLRALFGGAVSPPAPPTAAIDALTAAGFRPARVIAERDGWRFTEGMRPVS